MKPRPAHRRIAFLGTRGVPAGYGGFETFVEELGTRLAALGDEITVYGRSAYVERSRTTYEGIHLVTLPAPRRKYLETVGHTLLSSLHALTKRYDLIYVCNVANAPAAALLVLFRRRVIMNVDGLEWERKKWNAAGRAYLRTCSRVAALLPLELVTDAAVIESYYLTKFRRRSTCIPYGTRIGSVADDGTLGRLGVEADRYILYVSRLEPENNALLVIEGFRRVQTDLPLLIVGDAPYASSYIDQLRHAAAADPRVRIVGGIYGTPYHVLQSNATCYIQATEVGGAHPALIEAMGRGAAVVANDVPEHREVLASAGLYYSGPMALAAEVQRVLDEPDLRTQLARMARERALDRYSWGIIAEEYNNLFDQLLNR